MTTGSPRATSWSAQEAGSARRYGADTPSARSPTLNTSSDCRQRSIRYMRWRLGRPASRPCCLCSRLTPARSEERRVGKECRARWSQREEKRKTGKRPCGGEEAGGTEQKGGAGKRTGDES